MSNRPGPTPNRPNGTSTGGNKAQSREAKIARAKRHQLSPYPLCAVNGKNVNKQGFPNTGSKKK